MKKLITSIVFAVAAICAYAQSFEYEGINYNILSKADKTCEVARNYDISGDITIPETVTYNNDQYTVTSIGDWAFSYCKSLTSITLPEDVTSIGDRAFFICSSLIEINVDVNNTIYASIDGVVFSKDLKTLLICPSGKSGEYVVPEGVISIGYYAFYECSGLTSIALSESLTSIGNFAFSNCSSLTSIILPE